MKVRYLFVFYTVLVPALFWGVLIALAWPMAARASMPTPDVQAWYDASYACQGAPLDMLGRTNPVCKQRDKMTQGLTRQGAVLCNHSVWLMREDLDHFSVVMRHYQAMAEANPLQLYDMVPGILSDLRQRMTDEQIFAAWNLRAPVVRVQLPAAHVVMFAMMDKLAMHYARNPNPALHLER